MQDNQNTFVNYTIRIYVDGENNDSISYLVFSEKVDQPSLILGFSAFTSCFILLSQESLCFKNVGVTIFSDLG